MSEFIKKYEHEIKSYCKVNGLSYEKLLDSPHGWGNDYLFVTRPCRDSEKAALGMLDDTPAQSALEVFLENGKLRFEQTEITRKYLGADKAVNDTAAPRTSTTVAKPVRPSIPKRRRDLAYA